MSRIDRVLVAGGGIAAHRCVRELRRNGFEGEIRLLSAEHERPYDRTCVSKGALLGGAPSVPYLADLTEYAGMDVELVLGRRAVRLRPELQVLELEDGVDLRYDRLVIATGGRASLPSGLRSRAALVLRDLHDAETLRQRLAASARVTIVGGGFIGLEVASSAVQLGLDVTVVEAADAPLSEVLGPAVGRLLADLHRDHGVEVLTGSPVARIRDDDAGRATVSLRDGRSVAADVVVVAVGMSPAVDWLDGSGLLVEGGVVVDELCRTNVPNVLACGDCARWPGPGGRARRVEHWDVASRHGQAAARSLLGSGEPFAPVPYFWSDQHGQKLQFAGASDEADRVELDSDASPTGFVARYFNGAAPIAVLAMNRPSAIAEARRALRDRHSDAAVVR